jgi:hypothetical protein
LGGDDLGVEGEIMLDDAEAGEVVVGEVLVDETGRTDNLVLIMELEEE